MESKEFLIGYLLSEKSIGNLMIKSKLKDACFERGIKLREIKENIPIEEQGKFDAIFHKCSDYLRSSQRGNKLHERIIKEFINYESNNPGTILIDRPLSVLLLADRAKMLEICDDCQFSLNKINVYVPSWISVDSITGLKDRLKERNITFPVLFKARSAAEGEGAHDMQLIFNENQLDSLKLIPSVAQKFENHGGFLFKIFSVGKTFCVITRPSIRNITNPTSGDFLIENEMKESILFSSHDVSKPNSFSFLNNYQENYVKRYSYDDENCILDRQVVSKLISLFIDKLSCNLLGIDIILNPVGNYGIVDVNYLPSYDEMKNKTEHIAEFFHNLISTKEDSLDPHIA